MEHPRVREDVVFRRLGDDFAVLDPSKRVVHILNATAAAVWVLCDGTRSLDTITREIAEVFEDGDGSDVASDVERTVSDFAERGLLA